MTTAEILEYLHDYADDLEDDSKPLLADGMEDAILGLLECFGNPPAVCYDYDLCIQCLMRQGMTEDDAVEWMSYNVLGAYVGRTTPVFLTNLRARPAE